MSTFFERMAAQRQADDIAFFVYAVNAGSGVQITSEPHASGDPARIGGRINGMVSVPKYTPFARHVAAQAERRASTANV